MLARSVLLLLSGFLGLVLRTAAVQQPQQPIPDYMYNLFRYHTMLSFAVKTLQDQLKSWTCSYCAGIHAESVLIFSKTSFQNLAYAAYVPSLYSIVVVPRQTDNLLNELSNYDATPVQFDNQASHGYVHAGFKSIWTDLEHSNAILEILASMMAKRPTYNVLFIGHSSSSGVALIGGVKFLQMYPQMANRVSVTTLGGPRMGDSAFGAYVRSLPLQVNRLVNYCDQIVEYIQPGPYYHIGTQYWMNGRKADLPVTKPDTNQLKGPQVVTCNTANPNIPGEDTNCINSVPSSFLASADHMHYMGVHLVATLNI